MCAAVFRFIQKHLIEAILRHGSEQYETGHKATTIATMGGITESQSIALVCAGQT